MYSVESSVENIMSCAGGTMQVNEFWRIFSISSRHLELLTMFALKILQFAVRPACWRCRAHRPRVLYFPPSLPSLAHTARAAFRTMQLKVEVVSLWRRHPYPRHALLPCLSSIVAGPLGCRQPLLRTRLQPDNRSPSQIPIS